MFEDTLSGATYGLTGLAAGATVGAQRMISDIGGMMPPMASPTLHPYLQARHGMYAHEMSFVGSMMGSMGYGAPDTAHPYEFQELSRRDISSRMGTAIGMTGLYGSAAFASWHAGTALVGAGWKGGQHLGRHWQAGRVAAAGGSLRGGMAGIRAMGMLGGVAGVAASMAPLMAVEGVVSDIGTAVKDHQDISNFLEASSFRFATGSGADIDSHFGAGFNFRARGQIASNIAKVAQGDNFYSMQDLKGVLESGTEMGLFTGARDAEEFGKKFKDLTDTLKTVTRTLHVSLAEGMKVIKDLKDQGFNTGAAMQGALVNADVLGISSGRTAAEMLTIGRQGAEMVRGTGISMSTGSNMLQQTTGMVDMMYQSGALSRELVQQAGGTGALAQQMMGSSLNFMNSSFGRGMMMAMTSGGQFDAGAFQRMASGDLTMEGAMGMAQGAIGNPKDFIQAVINRNENMRQMTSQFGGMGAQFGMMGARITMGKSLMQTGLVDNMEDAIRFQMVTQGVSESEIEASIGMLRNSDSFKEQQMGALGVASEKARADLAQKRRDQPFAITRAYRTAIDGIAGGFTNMGDRIGITAGLRAFGKMKDKAFYGIEAVDVADMGAEREAELISNGTLDRAADMLLKATGATSPVGFSAEEAGQFAKSEEFTLMDKQYRGKTVSDAAINASSVDEYAQAIMGSSYGSLNKEQRMYLKTVADKTNVAMSERIGAAQLKEEVSFRDKTFSVVKDAGSRRDAAAERASGIRDDIIDDMVGFGFGRSAVKDLAKSKDGSKLVDDLISTQASLDRLGNVSSKERQDLEDKMIGLKQQFLGQLSKQGKSGQEAARQFLTSLDEKGIGARGAELGAARSALDEAEGDVFALSVRKNAVDYYDAVDYSGLKSSEERQALAKGVAGLKSLAMGGDADLGDLSSLTRLAAKSGNAPLARLLTQAAAKGDMFAAKDFLSHQGILEFKQDKVLGKEGNGMFGSDTAEINEAEKDTIRALAEVQAKTVDTLEQLKILAEQIKQVQRY